MDGGSIPPGSTTPSGHAEKPINIGFRAHHCRPDGASVLSFRPMTRIEVPNSSGRRRSGNRLGRWVMIVLLLVVVGSGLWTWLTLAWAYAEGDRAGVRQKFVRRGWICKTQEGEIALYYGGGQYLGPGNSQQLWDFSVRDKGIAEQLSKAVGHRVHLHYTEHPGIPTACFADTRYFVDRVTVTDNEPVVPATPAPGINVPAGNASTGNAPSGNVPPAPGPTTR
jgi:hypothetical protein